MTPASRRVLLLGGSGFLGREIARRLCAEHDLRSTHHNHADKAAPIRFDIYKDPPESLAVRDRDLIICSARLFDAQADAGAEAPARERSFLRLLRYLSRCRMLLLSTDAVFAGDRGLYAEDDPAEPVTAYGRRMRGFEQWLRAEVPEHCVLRASYLYGYSCGRLDKRLADSRDKLGRGERLEFYDDMYKSPLEVGQMADVVCALALSDFVGTVHAGGPRMSVYQFQREALAALGLETARLTPITMPRATTLARDTSLDTRLMTRLTRIVPHNIAAALTGGN